MLERWTRHDRSWYLPSVTMMNHKTKQKRCPTKELGNKILCKMASYKIQALTRTNLILTGRTHN